MDIETPKNVYLTAYYKKSFAYHTVKNRMPIILTKLIDDLHKDKDKIASELGQNAAEELKLVIGEISKFKYEIVTNKELTPLLEENSTDIAHYNNYLCDLSKTTCDVSHFNTIWLLAECYMYRKIKNIFNSTSTLARYDYFKTQKVESYNKALELMKQLGAYMSENYENADNARSTKELFISMLKLNLWSNKCDLSISLGQVKQDNTLFNTDIYESNVLSDHSEAIWTAISSANSSNIVDIILDNAGYELFTDLCLADFILTKSLAKTVRFYVKSIPWFISDVTEADFHWHLEEQAKNCDEALSTLAARWQDYTKNGTFQIVVDEFWTLPHDFTFMREKSPQLYRKLAEAKLLVFKGDLNYRKLFGERNWEFDTGVEVGLQGFHPAPLCTLRTIKADIVLGLKTGVGEKLNQENPEWMAKGDYAVIQFCDKIIPIDD